MTTNLFSLFDLVRKNYLQHSIAGEKIAQNDMTSAKYLSNWVNN